MKKTTASQSAFFEKFLMFLLGPSLQFCRTGATKEFDNRSHANNDDVSRRAFLGTTLAGRIRHYVLNTLARNCFRPGGFLVLLAWLVVSSNALAQALAPAATVTPDTAFQAMFESYGNDNTLLDDWTGADGAMSVVLPDGRVVWNFSDTFLGFVNSDGSRPGGQPLINNSMIVQDNGALVQTLHGGTAQSPTSLIIPVDQNSWYWVGDMTVEGDRLRVFVMEFMRTGPGIFDFQWVGNAIASFVLPDLTLENVVPTHGENNVMYGAALLEEGSYTYIYGTEDVSGTEKYLHIARATSGDVFGAWEFYTGTGWSSDPTASARLLRGVGNGFGVAKVGNRFVLFTMDSLFPFSDELVMYSSNNPEGPFANRRLVYRTPETRGNRFTYDAHVHPEFTDAQGRLLVSYDVNSLNFNDLLRNVDNYRPRFIRVKIGR